MGRMANPMSKILSKAEDELIDMLRDPDMSDIALNVTREGSQWHVRLDNIWHGYGLTFDEAWREMVTLRATR